MRRQRMGAVTGEPWWVVTGFVLLVLVAVACVLAYLIFMGWLALTFVAAVRAGDAALAAVVGGVWVGLALAAALGNRVRS